MIWRPGHVKRMPDYIKRLQQKLLKHKKIENRQNIKANTKAAHRSGVKQVLKTSVQPFLRGIDNFNIK